MENAVKRIGVLTSGGDAPGMNACIRAVVRSALARWHSWGLTDGDTLIQSALQEWADDVE